MCIIGLGGNGRPCFTKINAGQLCYHLNMRSYSRSSESRDVPLVLVGNKRDLVDSREVSTDEGLNLAKRSGCNFVETSAKCDVRVSDVFTHVLTRGFQQVSFSRSSSSIGGATTIITGGDDGGGGHWSHPPPPRSGSCSKDASSSRRMQLGRSRSTGIVAATSVVSNSNSIRSLFGAMTTGGGRSEGKHSSSSSKKSLDGGCSEGPEVVGGRSGGGKKRQRTDGTVDERKNDAGRCVLL